MSRRTEPALRAVADNVYAWVQPDGSWWVNNAGAIAAPDETILIDTCATERRTRAFLQAVAHATHGLPLTFAVNTHGHGDHAYGNSLLPDSTVIIGHEAARAGLLADPLIDGCPPFWDPLPDWGNVSRRPPVLTTSTGLRLHSGSIQVELRHPGYPAHTAGDLAVWLPGSRVLFTGDLLFNQVTPLVMAGSIEGAIRALDWIAAFGPDHVVPGHGPVLDRRTLPATLDACRRYYWLLLDTANAGLRGGLSPLDAARRCELGPFADLPDSERVVLNLHRAYADIADREFSLAEALTDTVTFHGGPMRTAV